ncbi:MAG TPA: porin [Blastocatellia bacterium]|jgi:phosphate-selective porin OprO/OprP|nr:porin [Blastocatellia bacterium]
MNARGDFYLIYLILALITLAAKPAFGQGKAAAVGTPQQRSGSEHAGATPEIDSSATPASKPDSRSQTELDQLKTKLDQMQVLIDQQQRALAELERRLDATGTKAQTAALTPAPSSETPSPVTRQSGAVRIIGGPARGVNLSGAAATSQAKAEDKPAPLAGWDKDRGRAFLRSADGSFETFVTGYGQLDYHGYQAGNVPPDTFLIRRARLIVEGKLERYFDWRIEGDFSDTTSTALRDFYVRVHRFDELQLTFGQVRVPISQEEIRQDAVQDFVERSLVNGLVPSRSPGMMASGVIGKGVFEYQVGAFNGKGLLAQNNNSTPEGALRLRFAPWKNSKDFWTRGIAFGGAYTQGRTLAGTSVRGQTESRSFTFFTPDTVNGQINRANGEFTWMLGPAAFRTEYVQTSQERENLGPGGTTLPGVVAKGTMALFTYLVTGETKPESGAVVPRNNLFGEQNGKPGFGAWELKLRYSNLQISDATAKSNRAETVFFGVNWYLNRYVRHLFDVGIERFGDTLRRPKPGANNFYVVLSRIQVSF